MSDVDTTARHLSSYTSKQKTDSYIMQGRECPHTRDTRLTGGSRLAFEAASACKEWRNESGLPISCGDSTLPRHDSWFGFM